MLWCPSARAATGSLVLHNPSTNALCLDGTPAGFYIDERQPHANETGGRWTISIEGGGWCTSTASCYERGVAGLGSSKAYKSRKPFDSGVKNETGRVSVLMPYCDGGSFTGFRLAPDVFNNSKIYYRGLFTFRATIDALLLRGMSLASEVILTGCSAGGLSAYLHAEYLRSRLATSTRLVVTPLAGFFMDFPAVDGSYKYREGMQWIFANMESQHALNPACLAEFPSDPWQCMLAANNVKHITSPLFPQQSVHDAWQVGGVLGLRTWDANVSAVRALGEQMLAELQPVLESKNNGAFLTDCVDHCNVENVSGTSARDAFDAWHRTLHIAPSGGMVRRIWSSAATDFPDKTCANH